MMDPSSPALIAIWRAGQLRALTHDLDEPTQLRRWEQKHPHALTDHKRRAWCVPAPALVHSDCSRPWQFFHAARAHQHAWRVVAAGRRVL